MDIPLIVGGHRMWHLHKEREYRMNPQSRYRSAGRVRVSRDFPAGKRVELEIAGDQVEMDVQGVLSDGNEVS
jgi:hypothetical protein